MANSALLIHPITSLPPNREPAEGWPWLSLWTVSITWPRRFGEDPTVTVGCFFLNVSQIFGLASILHESWKFLYMDFFLNKLSLLVFSWNDGCFFKALCCLLPSFQRISSSRTRISDSPSAPVCDFPNSGRPLMIHKHQILSILIAVWPYKVWRLRNSWPNWQFGWLAGWCVRYILVDVGWGSKKMELA